VSVEMRYAGDDLVPSISASSQPLLAFDSPGAISLSSRSQGSFANANSTLLVQALLVAPCLCGVSPSACRESLRVKNEWIRSLRKVRTTGIQAATVVRVGSKTAQQTSFHPSTAKG
jgi:hypothetical protein